MSIIDQIGKKVSKAATTATQKSNELIDVTKLNANISREEKEISDLYAQMGQECFRLYKENTQLPDELLILCEEIAAHFATIDSFKQEISAKKGIVICSNCGKESPKGTSFCGDCGSKLQQEEDETEEMT